LPTGRVKLQRAAKPLLGIAIATSAARWPNRSNAH
jgi:hypothetical protein